MTTLIAVICTSACLSLLVLTIILAKRLDQKTKLLQQAGRAKDAIIASHDIITQKLQRAEEDIRIKNHEIELLMPPIRNNIPKKAKRTKKRSS